MNEEGFYSTRLLRPFETKDPVHQDARLRSIVSLGTALWGRTALDLQHQLLRPYPEISTGFDLAGFRELLSVSARFEAIDLTDLRNARLRPLALFSSTVMAGKESYTAWEGPLRDRTSGD